MLPGPAKLYACVPFTVTRLGVRLLVLRTTLVFDGSVIERDVVAVIERYQSPGRIGEIRGCAIPVVIWIISLPRPGYWARAMSMRRWEDVTLSPQGSMTTTE